MIRYKLPARKAISFLFRHRNNINIYIEDRGEPALFESIIEKCLPNGYKCERPIVLGSKRDVIEVCSQDQTVNGSPKLYLVDGDLDLILDCNISDLKYFHCLSKYCIENYLIEEDGILKLLAEDYNMSRTDVKSSLNLKSFLEDIAADSISLFIHYALARKFGCECQTVTYSVEQLLSIKKNRKQLDSKKVKSRIENMRDAILEKVSEEVYDLELDMLKEKWSVNTETLKTIVSAKDFLIQLIIYRSKSISGSQKQISKDIFKRRMANHCKPACFDEIRNAILTKAS